MPDAWVRIGVVARAHGVRGAIKLKLDNEQSRTLRPGLVVRVGEREHRVARYAAGILTLEDVHDRDGADALRGQALVVRRADFPEQGLYLVDLVGAPAQLESGEVIGRVHGFIDNGPQSLLVVKRARGDEVSVPFVPALVVEATPARVVLRPPPGLLDDDAVVVPQSPEDDAGGSDADIEDADEADAPGDA